MERGDGAEGSLPPGEGAERAVDASTAWAEDMDKMKLGTKLLFMNDFGGAESVFASGMKLQRKKDGDKELRDLRGAFALQYALVSVIKGVASLANDQLDECLQRLWFAEELAAQDSEWLGKSVVRGICTLMGGVIQCLQHSFVKGVYNVLKSWMWIKVLQTDAVDYQGKEREVVRSCALFTLGIFNLLLSLLPTSMLKAAAFLSGFEGDRGTGLRMLKECWEENGMFSPWGALVWVAFQVDTKSFLDEPLLPADMAACREIFDWAREKFPNSVFFSGIEADLLAYQKRIDEAIALVDTAAPFAKELKALEWALNYKRGVYELTNLNFARAAQFFEASLEVYVRVGRRSMVPFMAMYSALCYHVVADQKNRIELELDERELEEDDAASNERQDQEDNGDEDTDDHNEPEDFLLQGLGTMDAATAAAHTEEMLSLVQRYKAMDKDNWGRQDKWAFFLYKEYQPVASDDADTGENSIGATSSFNSATAGGDTAAAALAGREPWPLLDLVESMIWRMRCTRWMEDAQTARLLELLQQEQAMREPSLADDEIRVCACFAQVLIERGQIQPALEWCEKGIDLQDDLSESARNVGYAMILHYLRALNMFNRRQLLSAKHSIKLLEKAEVHKKSWIYHYIIFKANLLKKQVAAVPFKELYESIDVVAGQKFRTEVTVTEANSIVSWDWVCTKFDIKFNAIFRPSQGDASPSNHDPNKHFVLPDSEDEDDAEDSGNEDGTDIYGNYKTGSSDLAVEVIANIARHDHSDGPCVGSYIAPGPGRLIFEWDNRHSFMRSKSILYRAKVTTAQERQNPE